MDDEQTSDHEPGGTPAVEQFQRAALDAVRAARALLDAAESVIQEPAAIEAMVNTITSMARSASEVVAGFAGAATGADGHAASEDDDSGPGGFEHIPVD